MILAVLLLWIASAILIIWEKRLIGIIIYISIFSLLASLSFLLFAALDVAMAEAVISVFSTIILIIFFEKYYSHKRPSKIKRKYIKFQNLFSILFTILLFAAFVLFIPKETADFELKAKYLSMFSQDIGGENAVTSIYLGYRLYDTLFEALILIISVAAIIHLSWYQDFFYSNEIYLGIKKSQIAVNSIRIISPFLLLFGIYIIVNGHLTPGGGFQGGVIIASFFICRYMIHDIYDIPIGKVLKLEKLFYIAIVLLASVFLAFVAYIYSPIFKNIYLISMNLLIGIKVVFGFYIIFFRFIAFERG